MDNGHKVLSILLGVAIIVILLMRSCGGGSNTGGQTTSDTVRVETFIRDTIIVPVPVDKIVTKTITVRIPVPYIDTTSGLIPPREFTLDEFDDLFNERPMVYQDTISDDTISIHYRIRSWGFIDKMELGYTIKNQYYIRERETIETTIVKKKQTTGLYIGMDAAANDGGLTHLAAMLEIVTPGMTYSAGYDLNDQSFVIGARARIRFRKRQREIPIP